MSTVKLSVTIVLPGSTMMTSQECDENPQENYENNFILLSVKKYDYKTKKSFFRKEPLEFKTRKCVDAQQVIKMSDEAYENMTSVSCPEWFIPKGGINAWKKMSKEQRLEAHLDRVCKAMGGKSYTYAVFSD